MLRADSGPPQSHVRKEVLTSGPQRLTVFGDGALKEVIELK